MGDFIRKTPLYRNTKTLQKRNGRKDYTIRVALKITFGATLGILY